jgi:phosphoglycolate phosphatase-like HAD superfamily hydrolase
LIDSNTIKEANIRAATAAVVSDDSIVDDFVRYFVANNGVPRQTKISAVFPKRSTADAILTRYNRLNSEGLSTIALLPEARQALEALASHGIRMHALSGGEEREVVDILMRNEAAGYFDGIHGGPTTKLEHAMRLSLPTRTCFIGDSEHDFEVARELGLSFVFLYRYTQFGAWRTFFADHPEVRIESDLSFITA